MNNLVIPNAIENVFKTLTKDLTLFRDKLYLDCAEIEILNTKIGISTHLEGDYSLMVVSFIRENLDEQNHYGRVCPIFYIRSQKEGSKDDDGLYITTFHELFSAKTKDVKTLANHLMIVSEIVKMINEEAAKLS